MVISPTLMVDLRCEGSVVSRPSRRCQLRRDRTGNAVVDPRRLRAFTVAAEFRPLLRSQGAVHAAVLIAEAEPPLDRLGRPRPVAPIGTLCRRCQVGGTPFPHVVQAVTSSPSGSGTSSGFLEKLRMKSAALLACADAMKMKRESFRIAWSQLPT